MPMSNCNLQGMRLRLDRQKHTAYSIIFFGACILLCIYSHLEHFYMLHMHNTARFSGVTLAGTQLLKQLQDTSWKHLHDVEIPAESMTLSFTPLDVI